MGPGFAQIAAVLPSALGCILALCTAAYAIEHGVIFGTVTASAVAAAFAVCILSDAIPAHPGCGVPKIARMYLAGGHTFASDTSVRMSACMILNPAR